MSKNYLDPKDNPFIETGLPDMEPDLPTDGLAPMGGPHRAEVVIAELRRIFPHQDNVELEGVQALVRMADGSYKTADGRPLEALPFENLRQIAEALLKRSLT